MGKMESMNRLELTFRIKGKDGNVFVCTREFSFDSETHDMSIPELMLNRMHILEEGDTLVGMDMKLLNIELIKNYRDLNKHLKHYGHNIISYVKLLKEMGHDTNGGDMYSGFVSKLNGRKYRHRCWGENNQADNKMEYRDFIIDVSDVDKHFDRWANSTALRLTYAEFMNGETKITRTNPKPETEMAQ